MNIKENILYIVRNYIKKYLTGNLGRVVEEEDKLICYVDIFKIKNGGFNNTIICSGIKENDRLLAETYKLNKPIYYVLDNLEFNKLTNIFGYNCDVYINDCEFSKGAFINVNGKCTIEATDFKVCYEPLSIHAKELVIEDLYLNNYYWDVTNLTVNLSATDKLKIIGSTIGAKNNRTYVSLTSNNDLIINGSTILGDCVKCEAKNIYCDESTIIDSADNEYSRFLKND